jgi:ATP-dependent DNA ligase
VYACSGGSGTAPAQAVTYLVFDLLWLDGRLLAGARWSRPGPGEPAPVFVRPELAVEVSFLGWESGHLRHPAYGGLTRIL